MTLAELIKEAQGFKAPGRSASRRCSTSCSPTQPAKDYRDTLKADKEMA
jgi:hypothetical protein